MPAQSKMPKARRYTDAWVHKLHPLRARSLLSPKRSTAGRLGEAGLTLRQVLQSRDQALIAAAGTGQAGSRRWLRLADPRQHVPEVGLTAFGLRRMLQRDCKAETAESGTQRILGQGSHTPPEVRQFAGTHHLFAKES